MPEEINRILSDSVSDLLFITEKEAEMNLLREGVLPHKIHFVGNVMIDSLRQLTGRSIPAEAFERFGLMKSDYALITLHRPETVDDKTNLNNLVHVLQVLKNRIHLIFPVHPRTRAKLTERGWIESMEEGNRLRLVEPIGYLDFINLMKGCRFVLTDSGGIQEETTALGVPCITVRKSTERPVTVTEGTNVVAGLESEKILEYCEKALSGKWKTGSLPALWDGKASERIVSIICNSYL